MRYRMWFLCFEYLLYNEIMCWFLEQSHVCCDNKDVNSENAFTNQTPTSARSFSIYGYTVIYILRVVSKSCSILTSICQWGWCSFCSLVKGSGVWLAPGAGSGSVCKHGSCLDLLWADASTGLTSGPGAGEMKQKNWICSEKGADRPVCLCSTFSDVVFKHDFLRMFRSWALNTHCTRRSCSWLCRPSAQRRRIIRESWTSTGWPVSTSCQSKT